MQVNLPEELAEQIRAVVRSGAFATESDVIVHQFAASDESFLPPGELDEAFRLGFVALDEMKQSPDGWLTPEEVLARREQEDRRSAQPL